MERLILGITALVSGAVSAAVLYAAITNNLNLLGLAFAVTGGFGAWCAGLWPLYRRLRPYRCFGWPGRNAMGLRERFGMARIWPAYDGRNRSEIVQGVLTRWCKDVWEIAKQRRSLRGFI